MKQAFESISEEIKSLKNGFDGIVSAMVIEKAKDIVCAAAKVYEIEQSMLCLCDESFLEHIKPLMLEICYQSAEPNSEKYINLCKFVIDKLISGAKQTEIEMCLRNMIL